MKKRLTDIDVKNKLVFVRVDFNVPYIDGVVTDDKRIVEAIPTINYLIENDAKIVLLSHFGKINHKDSETLEKQKKDNDLNVVVPILEKHLNSKIFFHNKTRGFDFKILKPKEVVLLQNTRHEEDEEKNGEDLIGYWASSAEVFVMDAFGTAHRKHASTYGLPKKMREENKQTALGFLVEKEVESLSKLLSDVRRPYVAILGGAKVSSKLKVIDALLDRVDKLIIGGAMGHTFLAAMGYEMSEGRIEKDQFIYINHCLRKGKDKIIIGLDHIIANDFATPTIIKESLDRNVEKGFMPLDIGPKTREYFKEEISNAKTIFWNGPLGVFENPSFAEGTKYICETIASMKDVFSVIGGGDSAAASIQFGCDKGFSHISTGGGASLEMIENDGKLPGIEIIEDKED